MRNNRIPIYNRMMRRLNKALRETIDTYYENSTHNDRRNTLNEDNLYGSSQVQYVVDELHKVRRFYDEKMYDGGTTWIGCISAQSRDFEIKVYSVGDKLSACLNNEYGDYLYDFSYTPVTKEELVDILMDGIAYLFSPDFYNVSPDFYNG